MDITLMFDAILTFIAGLASRLIGIRFTVFGATFDLLSLFITFIFLSVVFSIFWHKAHK